MRRLFAASLAAILMTAATGAEAHYQGYSHRHYDDDDAAAAAVLGFALGAALGGGGYYDRGYYAPRTYYYDRGYYAPRAYYYDRPYYAPGYYYAHPRRMKCRTSRMWDPYYGGYVRVRRCR